MSDVIRTWTEEPLSDEDDARLWVIAEQIYTLVDGADHATHKGNKTQRIHDWLADGYPERDLPQGEDVEALAAEWADFDAVGE